MIKLKMIEHIAVATVAASTITVATARATAVAHADVAKAKARIVHHGNSGIPQHNNKQYRCQWPG